MFINKFIKWLIIISVSVFCGFSIIYFISTTKEEATLALKVLAVFLGSGFFIDGFGLADYKESFLDGDVICKFFISLVFSIGSYVI